MTQAQTHKKVKRFYTCYCWYTRVRFKHARMVGLNQHPNTAVLHNTHCLTKMVGADSSWRVMVAFDTVFDVCLELKTSVFDH